MEEARVEIEGISLSHPGKIVFPEQNITKLAVAEYYTKIAPWMLPELKGRPVSLVRCPAGRSKKCFFQKHPDPAMSAELKTVPIKGKEESGIYVLVEDKRDLIYLVQMNVLEIHCWGARTPKIEYPDRMIFDLDPDKSVSVKAVIQAALEMRELLKSVGLESFVKTSGGKGLHVVVPLDAKSSWNDVHDISAALATSFAEENPKLYIATSSLKRRSGKIFVDYLRNSKSATSIANYSTRARANASLAVPLSWKEMQSLKSFNGFTVKNIFRRISKKFQDPWEELYFLKQKLPRLN